MLNNPVGSDKLVDALGRGRVLLGFPGAGGTRDGHTVRYTLIAQQPTTLGELSGRQSDRLRDIAVAFQAAGFPTKISGGGDCHRLSDEAQPWR